MKRILLLFACCFLFAAFLNAQDVIYLNNGNVVEGKVVKNADLDVLGGNFRAITDAQKEQLNIGYGLEVIKVSGGKLKDAGVPKGFIIQRVNDKSIKSIEDMQDAVKEASTSKEPVLYIQGIYPTGKKGYFAVPLQNE